MTTTDEIKYLQGKAVSVLEYGSNLSKVAYTTDLASDFWAKTSSLTETDKQISIRSKQDTSFTRYLPYDENKEFFDDSDFGASLLTHPEECYWLAGWFEKRGSWERHDPILVDGEVVRRGATLHVIFPNPEFPGLDSKVGEFFDPFRKGYIMINSASAFRFFENFFAGQVPPEYQMAYEKGIAGSIL